MRIIIAFFCVALLWACLGKLDIVAVAPGKTVVDSRTKIVKRPRPASCGASWCATDRLSGRASC